MIGSWDFMAQCAPPLLRLIVWRLPMRHTCDSLPSSGQ